MAKKALLMILDGWGIGKHGKGDVIFNTPTPYLDYLQAVSSVSQLQASGEDVGLPDGQMGNSEVGHLNIGAGRIVYQDLVKINRACKDGSIAKNPQVVEAYTYAKENGKKLHLMGLTSNGGVHSSLDHLFKLIEVGKEYGLKDQTFVHCFMDGRDTDPRSGKGFIEQLSEVCKANDAAIASIIGRFYAMDRDKRWERVKEAYDLLVSGTGKKATDMVKAMQESYDEGVTDEFIKAISNANVNGNIEEGDVVIFINFRNDRAKELTQVLTQENIEDMKTIPGLKYYCMTPYDANFTLQTLSVSTFLSRVRSSSTQQRQRSTLTLHSSSMVVVRLHTRVRIVYSLLLQRLLHTTSSQRCQLTRLRTSSLLTSRRMSMTSSL